jgi:hypothetical protein
MAGAAAGALPPGPPPRYNKYRLYFIYKVILVRRPSRSSSGVQDSQITLLLFFRLLLGLLWVKTRCWQKSIWPISLEFKKKGFVLNKVSSSIGLFGSHRSFISISHHPLSREYIVSHFFIKLLLPLDYWRYWCGKNIWMLPPSFFLKSYTYTVLQCDAHIAGKI